jgi:hypothetical protein
VSVAGEDDGVDIEDMSRGWADDLDAADASAVSLWIVVDDRDDLRREAREVFGDAAGVAA